MERIFLSYRRADDKGIVGRIHDHLTARFGAESVFWDRGDIPPGHDFKAAIEHEIGACNIVLAIIGPEWAVNHQGVWRINQPGDHVRDEIELALLNEKVVIPVLIYGAEMPRRETLPESLVPLLTINAIPVRETFDFENDIQRLSQAIERVRREAARKRPFVLRNPLPTIAMLVLLALVGMLALILRDGGVDTGGGDPGAAGSGSTQSAQFGAAATAEMTTTPVTPTRTLTPTATFTATIPIETLVWLDMTATVQAEIAGLTATPTPPVTPTVSPTPLDTPDFTATYALAFENARYTVTAQSWTATPAITATDSARPVTPTPLPQMTLALAWSQGASRYGICPGFILYHTERTGDWEIYRYGEIPQRPNANPNISQGAGERVSDLAPSLSPNAEWIAFTSNRDGSWEIYKARTDGSYQERVTYAPGTVNTDPVWSTVGDYIAYESARDGNWDLYLVDLRSGAEQRLTEDPANDLNPFWSPYGDSLLFQSDRDGLWQIYALDVETLEVTRLSDGQGDDHDPQYTQDGQYIVFRSYRYGDNSVIMVMRADGSQPVRVSFPDGDALNAVTSYDGSLLAYQSNLDGDDDIYVYEFASGKTRKLTDNSEPDYAPTWWCYGLNVVFTSTVSGNPDLYSVYASPMDARPVDVATNAKQLTTSDAPDQYPLSLPGEENASRERRVPGAAKNQ